jgi:hypothetical protein
MKYVDLPHGNAALALFPSVVGFGWMLFDGPLSPVRWGVSNAARRKDTADAKNERCLKAIEKLLQEHHPPVIVLEAFEGPGARRGARIQKVCRSIVSLAAVQGVSVRVLTRTEIRNCFVQKPKTRHAVAKIVASYLVEIERRLPDVRKAWQTEDEDMALFNAAALLIVHYANPREPL